jgi:protein-S-isoprenylcysteine O-methyltransferase Ste14
MELFPALQIGWLNGWILLCVCFSILGVLLLAFPNDVVRRLYDRSGWSKREQVLNAIGKLVNFTWFALVILTPLKIGTPVFAVGAAVFALGLIGFVVALLNYNDTPLGQPVTKGFYKISRNPQVLMLYISFCGISIAIGSWAALFMQFISQVFSHARILAEEGSCLRQYGDSYRAYMERVPRYFPFF